MEIIQKVRALETAAPPERDLLTNPIKSKVLNGTWFLQYTSPSVVGGADDFPDSWKPAYAVEGDSNVETKQVSSRGSVNAAGVTVDTSNRVVEQIINVDTATVTNRVETGWGRM